MCALVGSNDTVHNCGTKRCGLAMSDAVEGKTRAIIRFFHYEQTHERCRSCCPCVSVEIHCEARIFAYTVEEMPVFTAKLGSKGE